MKRFLVYAYTFICVTGVWIVPTAAAAYTAAAYIGYVEYSKETLNTVVYAGVMLMFLNMTINSVTYANGKRKYRLLDALNYKTDSYMRATKKLSAMYPPVNEKLLFRNPRGIILGKKGTGYVCNDPETGGAHHTFCLGESGCGKTSTIVLDTILTNPNAAIMAFDIKGELYQKGTMPDDPNIVVIYPGMREGAYGYNPFYEIADTNDPHITAEVLREVALSLVPVNPKESNPFWTNSARDLLNALLLFFFNKGDRNLIDIIDDITSCKTDEVIETVYNEAEEGSVERKLIARFVGMADETLSGINGQMMSSVSLFISDENIRYMLRDNPLRADPGMFDKGKSIFVHIPENKVEAYATVLQLIANQTISRMETRREGGKSAIIIIDELPRILSAGKIHKLENALETLRSRNVTLLLIAQSLEAVERAYTKEAVQAMLTNCPYKVVLSASSPATQDAVVRWAGKYEEYKYGSGQSGTKRSSSLSYEWKNIVEPAELITLPERGEAIVISPYGYMRLKKVPYYKDRYIGKRTEEIKKARKRAIKGGDDGNGR